MWDYTSELNIEELLSTGDPAVIFKHSNSCSISSMALNRTMASSDKINKLASVYLIDVKLNRSVSLEVAERLNIRHESPQVIVIKNGKVVHHASHMSIRPETILSHL